MEKADKNNSSEAAQEQLFYLNPPDRDNLKHKLGFRPQLRSDEDRQAEEKGQYGFLYSHLLPTFKENPIVPIGLSLTMGALFYGIYCMGTGQQRKSHLMMRYRVGFQFITFVAIVSGFYRRDIKRSLLEKFEADAAGTATDVTDNPVTNAANNPVTDSKE